MRELIDASKNGNERAILTRDVFASKIANYVISYINELGSVDAITLTGGIGENDKGIIRDIFNKINIFDIKILNDFSNSEEVNLISDKKSEIKIYIVPTNEEYFMAKLGKELIDGN